METPVTRIFCVDYTDGLLITEGLLQIAHHMGSWNQTNSTRKIWFLQDLITDGIALCGFILDFVPLNKNTFERYDMLLSWFWTWIGDNDIELLTPEVLLEEVHVRQVSKKIDDGIRTTYHSKGTFYESPSLQWQIWR